MGRLPRVAFLLLSGLDHFVPDLLAALAASRQIEARAFRIERTSPDLAAALAWTDDPSRDCLWFEFCWPPVQSVIAQTDFGGRRVLIRIHRIEAYGSDNAVRVPWSKVTDAIVVGQDMARRLLAAVPHLTATTALHVVHNGVDLRRHSLRPAGNPFRIGWCGWMSLHKNPNLALEILHRLRAIDARYHLQIASKGGEAVAVDSFVHLAQRLGLAQCVRVDEGIAPADMPDWHARNAVLLSTSVYESFGYAIAEAAAAGCDLAMLDHSAAGEFWPAETRFASVDEAVRLITNARPHRWRGLVEARFSLERQASAVCALLLAPRPTATECEIDIGYDGWRGRFIVRNRADHIQGFIAATGGFYEPALLSDLAGRLPRGGLFVDAGANVGNHTLFAAGVCGANVVAFEPSPPLADHCAANLRANHLLDRVLLRREGLSARSGRARLQPGPDNNTGMTSLEAIPGFDEPGAVPMVRLDDVLPALQAKPDVIKIDVEGMELDVLRGAADIISSCRPALYVEAARPDAFEAVAALLAAWRYRPAARFNATPTFLFLPEDRLAA